MPLSRQTTEPMLTSGLAEELSSLRAYGCPAELPRAFGESLGVGEIRRTPEDFRVIELGVEPTGFGEHVFFRIRKTGQNTRWVAKRLAEQLQLPYRMVSYAGLKDRHAVTEQWFCAHMPGTEEPPAGAISLEGCEIRRITRHDRKLRTGQLSCNRFEVRVRTDNDIDPERLQQRLRQIGSHGVPNYFGQQRFGRDLHNLDVLQQPLAALGREERSFAISAARSALFNGYLAARVTAGQFDCMLDGDVLISDRPRGIAEDDISVFRPARLPTGLLWGKEATLAQEVAGKLEDDWFRGFPETRQLLESAGVRAGRRAVISRVAEPEASRDDEGWVFHFALNPGAYATTVLWQILDLKNEE